MKKIFFASLLLLIINVVHAQTKNFLDQPYIEMTGRADSLVTPNEIFIKIIISENDTHGKVSIEKLETEMVSSFKSLGINTEKDLSTSDILSNFKTYFLKQKDVIKTKEYSLKVSTAVMATKVFIQLEKLDIANSSINRVSHTDMQGIRKACLAKAVKNAKDKAIAATRVLGQSIGNAIYIITQDNNFNDDAPNRMYAMSMHKEAAEPEQIDFQKIKVSSNATVSFILK